ncbi:hypothetical protein [Streptomyces zaomyceticus]|uniref:hypothetical protein n=1 Tax=Streptomyces zaomyceticus TaxID=68286 RepID=UPI0016779C81|nr:hypothetical protein [Streptomyces zaomyceticus]GHG10409.1 hypothetical protein GCM10018791_24560 [Streptomyces zaomyceticus]
MAKTIDDLSKEISDLTGVLLTADSKVSHKVPNPTDDEEAKEKTPFVDGSSMVSKLKKSLVGDPPKILTEENAAPFIKEITDIHEEVVKAPLTEWLEAAGLDGVAAGVEKIYEGKDNWWTYFIAAFIGLAIPAIGLLLVSKFTDWSRFLQSKVFGGQAYARNEAGTWSRQDLQAINDRETRVFNGGGISAIPSEDSLRGVREELEKLTEKITIFNRKAGGFRTKFNKMPSARAIKKSAQGIEAIADALDRITISDVGAMATQADELKRAMEDFKPGKIPQDLQTTRTETRNLGRTVDELKASFQRLKDETVLVTRALA